MKKMTCLGKSSMNGMLHNGTLNLDLEKKADGMSIGDYYDDKAKEALMLSATIEAKHKEMEIMVQALKDIQGEIKKQRARLEQARYVGD